MVKVKQVTMVLAKWCPHCVPSSLDYAERVAKELKVPLRVLDIDVLEEEIAADKLVEQHGDYVEDYIIPQVFLEYFGGRVDHIYTGFSENISVTEARWKDLLNSRYYLGLQAAGEVDQSLAGFVERHLAFEVTCRHCDAPASFKLIVEEQDKVVGIYQCPEGLVSQTVYFSLEPNLQWFYTFLCKQLGTKIVEMRDLRIATRHGWELGEKAAEWLERFTPKQRRPAIFEVYWRRYAKTDADKSIGVFHCDDQTQGKGCGKLFVKPITSKNKLCAECR